MTSFLVFKQLIMPDNLGNCLFLPNLLTTFGALLDQNRLLTEQLAAQTDAIRELAGKAVGR